jgi:hypothetical protein
MTYQAALQKIEQARAEQWEELDLSGIELCNTPDPVILTNLRSTTLAPS